MVTFYDASRNLVEAPGTYSSDADGFPTAASWLTPGEYVGVEDLHLATSLAVLGEPGVGKSTVIERLCAARDDVVFVHLDEVTTVDRLEGAFAIAAATAGTAEDATLVLDGLDEWTLPLKALARRLAPLLDVHPRLQVIVGCRSANWSDSLASLLKQARATFVVYELMPLGAAQVRDAAVLNGLNGDDFVREVRSAGVASLAMRPLTLNLLLDLYAEDHQMPGTPTELFARGVTVLAAEHDAMRVGARDTRGTSVQLALVASRLAACLVVSGRSALTFASPPAPADIDLATLFGGVEGVAAGEFEVTPGLVQDTVETALFVGRGDGRFALMHASLAAYLAARYLLDRQLPEHQLRAMLTRSTGTVDPGIPTQLHETAAWLLALAPEVNGWIVGLAPDALLSHAAYIRDDAIRARLVELLLSDHDLAIQMRWRTWRLLHAGLYEQLAPHLEAPLQQEAGADFGHPVSAQAGTAIDIAVQSREVRAVDVLVGLAMASSLNPHLRARAGRAVLRLDPARAESSFQPLLDEVVEHPERDPDDELRGIALNACSRTLPAQKLVEALRQPKRNRTFIGHYATFVSGVIEDSTKDQIRSLVQLARTDSAQVREVLLSDGRGRSRTPLLSRLLHRVFADHELREELWDDAVWLLAFCICSHVPVILPAALFGERGDKDDARLRRDLALAVTPVLPENRVVMVTQPVWFADDARGDREFQAPLIGPGDFTWLCKEASGLSPDIWNRLVKWSYDPNSPQHAAVLAELARNDARFAWVGTWLQQLAARQEEDREFESDPSWEGRSEYLQRLTTMAELVADGDADACGDLVALLSIDPETGYSMATVDTEIEQWPGWALLESSDVVDLTLPRLATACGQFVASAVIPDGPWLTEAGSIDRKVLQVAAMVDLAVKDAGIEIAADSWLRIAPVVIRSPFDPMNDGGRRATIKRLAEYAPDSLRSETLRYLRDQYAAGWSSSSGLWMLSDVFDATSAAALLALAKELATRIADVEAKLAAIDPEPTTGSPAARLLAAANQELFGLKHWFDSILEFLLTHSGDHAVDISAMLDGRTPTVVSVQAQTGVQLLRHDCLTWARLWALCEAEEALGIEVIAILAQRIEDDRRLLALLTPEELGVLWRWLAELWSPETDRWQSGFITHEQRQRDFRDGVARHLEMRGDADSLEVLRQLSRENEGNHALREMVWNLTVRLRDEYWEGTTPSQLFELVADSSRVVVHDADSLFRLVVGLLDGLAQRIGDIGELLWNEIPPVKRESMGTKSSEADVRGVATFRPKYEAQISLLIHDHLRDELNRGIVSNREVLVRQTNTKGAGLAVDVLVTAIDPDGGGREIHCPIEVKGNWNRKLLTDLREQLVDDYMADLRTPLGIYAYAWFDVVHWTDKDDTRLAQVRKIDRETVAQKLSEAAASAVRVGARVHVQRFDVPRATPSARVKK